VVLIPYGLEITDPGLMRIAAENNLSETAFVRELSAEPECSFSKGSNFGLRWLTPTKEVNLCGHATLATAAVLLSVLNNPSQVLAFETLSGTVSACVCGDLIELDFPINKPVAFALTAQLKPLVEQVLGEHVSLLDEVVYSSSTKKLVLVLGSLAGSDAAVSALRSLAPDPKEMMASHDGSMITGVSVGCRATDPHFDFYSRYFAPWNGIDEDPVNGSSHTVLAPYWGERLGKTNLVAKQCSAREGTLHLEVAGDRVKLKGVATLVIEGSLVVPDKWLSRKRKLSTKL